MSIWDHIKPSKAPPSVTGVDLSPDRRTLTLSWDDGKTTPLTARQLRQICPCAVCVDEWTKKLRHDPSKVPETTTIQGVQPVGNYALSLTFNDSHSTGIFTWELLRKTAEPPTSA